MNLDFETYCDLDLTKVGLHRYAEHPSFEVLCLAWKTEAMDEPVLWLPGDKPDPRMVKAFKNETLRAYNATFEIEVIEKCFPELGLDEPPPVSQWIDTQALVCTNSYPASLDDAGSIILQEKFRKDKRGKELIKLLCKPRKPTKADSRTRLTKEDEPGLFQELYDYCLKDVVAESEIVKVLPRPYLQKKEQKIWEHTVLQNKRGLPIDIEMVDQVVDVLEEWKGKRQEELIEYTGGVITTGGQIARMKKWAEHYKYPMPTFDQEAMAKALKDPNLPEEVERIIEFRQQLGKSSTAKFNKLQEMLCEDTTVKGNLFYYGTITGRYGGRGFQMQNLPRAKTKDPESLREKFMRREVEGNVAVEASKLIRPAILAPEGKILCVADFSSVENRGLHWLANDQHTLDEFREGKDQYATFAAARFGVSYGELMEGYEAGEDYYDNLRFRGKVAILGLGYKMWVDTYIATCESWGFKIDKESATEDVMFYRQKYKEVVKLWSRLYKAAVLCVQHNQPTQYNNIRFQVIQNRLYMILPSGRPIVYNRPKVEKVDYFGKQKTALTFMGRNPYTTKWMRMQITEGRMTENAAQGLCRDIQCYGALNCEEAGYHILGSVHDENISMVDEGFGSVEEFCDLNCSMGEWADGLPLEATGYMEKRYRKD